MRLNDKPAVTLKSHPKLGIPAVTFFFTHGLRRAQMNIHAKFRNAPGNFAMPEISKRTIKINQRELQL
jgi:hypothetical protein